MAKKLVAQEREREFVRRVHGAKLSRPTGGGGGGGRGGKVDGSTWSSTPKAIGAREFL